MNAKRDINKSKILRKRVETLLIAIFCGMMVCCAAWPLKSNEITGSFETNLSNLDLDNSFAFTRMADEFYFSRVLITEGVHKCRFFIGFKNGQFKYRFPAHRLAELAKIHDEEHSIQSKKDRILQKIDGFAFGKQNCTAEIAEREATIGESVEVVVTNLLYAPLAAVGLIGMVTFGAADTVQSIKDSILEKRMDQLRLGKSTAEVKLLLDSELTANHTGSYSFYSIDYGYYRRLVMVFENDRLTGMIRGSRNNSPAPK